MELQNGWTMEKYLADGGYRSQDGNTETPTGHNNHDQQMKARARAQCESINALFKQYAILRDHYHHDQDAHASVFKAEQILCKPK